VTERQDWLWHHVDEWSVSGGMKLLFLLGMNRNGMIQGCITFAVLMTTAGGIQLSLLGDPRVIKGVFLDRDTGIGVSGVKIELFYLKPNILAPRSWTNVAEATSDEQSEYTFETQRRSPYQIRWKDTAGEEFRLQIINNQGLDESMRLKIEHSSE